MSETWTTKCPECEGSGESCPIIGKDKCEKPDSCHEPMFDAGNDEWLDSCEYICDCPTCQGSGSVAIGVECGNYKHMDRGDCEPCLDTEPIPDRCYRPLTTLEVEELIQGIKHFHPQMEASVKSLLWLMQNTGGVTYKGHAIKLIPA